MASITEDVKRQERVRGRQLPIMHIFTLHQRSPTDLQAIPLFIIVLYFLPVFPPQFCDIQVVVSLVPSLRQSRAMRPPKNHPAKPHGFLTHCSLNPETSCTTVSEETPFSWATPFCDAKHGLGYMMHATDLKELQTEKGMCCASFTSDNTLTIQTIFNLNVVFKCV